MTRLHNTTIARLRTHWENLCKNGALPYRQDLDPRPVHADLANMFIVEQKIPGHGRLRVAGQNLQDTLSLKPHGDSFLVIFDRRSWDGITEAMSASLEDPAIITIDFDGFSFRKSAGSGVLAMCPMLNDDGRANLAVGALEWTVPPPSDVYGTPRLLTKGIHVERVNIAEPIAPQPGFHHATLRPTAAPRRPLASNSAVVRPIVGRATGVPFLRVVDGGL